jgi:hypothetical protein
MGRTDMDVAVPVHAPNTHLEQSDAGTRIHRSGSSNGVLLDDTALALWELCDGETTVSEIITAVYMLFSAPRETVAADVRVTLQHLENAGLLAWKRPEGNPLELT